MNEETTKTEKLYMNLHTGSVDTEDGWAPYSIHESGLVEVVYNEKKLCYEAVK